MIRVGRGQCPANWANWPGRLFQPVKQGAAGGDSILEHLGEDLQSPVGDF